MTDLKGADEEPPKPVDSTGRDLHLLNSLRMRGDGDEEELQMLASLKREQEEDECRAPGLSASQIHQCNVSISMSCGDASTWTYVSMVCAIHLIYTVDLLLVFFSFFFLLTIGTYTHLIYIQSLARLFLSLPVILNNFPDPG